MSPPTAALEKLLADLERSIPLDVLPPISTSKQVAVALGTTESVLAQDRYQHKGITYTKVGRRVRYLRSDVLDFLATNRVEGVA